MSLVLSSLITVFLRIWKRDSIYIASQWTSSSKVVSLRQEVAYLITLLAICSWVSLLTSHMLFCNLDISLLSILILILLPILIWYFRINLVSGTKPWRIFSLLTAIANYSSASLRKRWNFPLRISSINMTKSVGNCGFGHIYWRNL